MEPFTPVAQRGPVPIPPQRTNKATNSVSSGTNPPQTTSALPPKVINSVSGNQTNLGNERFKNNQEFIYLWLQTFLKNDLHSFNVDSSVGFLRFSADTGL